MYLFIDDDKWFFVINGSLWIGRLLEEAYVYAISLLTLPYSGIQNDCANFFKICYIFIHVFIYSFLDFQVIYTCY